LNVVDGKDIENLPVESARCIVAVAEMIENMQRQAPAAA